MAKITLSKEAVDALPSEELKKIASPDPSNPDVMVLDVVPAEFRDANISLKQEMETLKGRVNAYRELIGTEDLTKAAADLGELRDLKTKVDTKKLIEETSFEEALKTRTQEMRQIHEANQRQAARQIEEKDSIISNLKREKDDQALSTQLQLAVMSEKSGIRPEAFLDVLHRARGSFKVEGGKLVARDEKGEQIYGEDANPLTVDGWLKRLTEEAPHFLKGSAGGGASGGRGGNRSFSSEDYASMDQKTFERLRAEAAAKK